MKSWLYGRHAGWATVLIGMFAVLTLGVVLCTVVGVIGAVRHGPAGRSPGVSVAGSATGVSPTRAPSPFKLAVGLSVTIDSGPVGSSHSATVSKVEPRAVGCGDYTEKPKTGTYTLATVELTVLRGAVSVNPLYWSLVDKSGRVTDSLTGVMSGCGTLASANDLPAGMLRSGVVVFDAPLSPGSEVLYSSPFGTPQASWVAP